MSWTDIACVDITELKTNLPWKVLLKMERDNIILILFGYFCCCLIKQVQRAFSFNLCIYKCQCNLGSHHRVILLQISGHINAFVNYWKNVITDNNNDKYDTTTNNIIMINVIMIVMINMIIVYKDLVNITKWTIGQVELSKTAFVADPFKAFLLQAVHTFDNN